MRARGGRSAPAEISDEMLEENAIAVDYPGVHHHDEGARGDDNPAIEKGALSRGALVLVSGKQERASLSNYPTTYLPAFYAKAPAVRKPASANEHFAIKPAKKTIFWTY